MRVYGVYNSKNATWMSVHAVFAELWSSDLNPDCLTFNEKLAVAYAKMHPDCKVVTFSLQVETG